MPWRIISLLREFADEVNVLVPYRAYSAATMICLGSDSILMGRKGELGPIDPAVVSDFNPVDAASSNRKMPINVEDVTSYRNLIRDRFEITSSEDISKPFLELTKAVNPIALGYINRHYSFIRMVATKLLKSRNEPFADETIKSLVEELVEKIYFHGHGIARKEAKDLGLQVIEPGLELEKTMWNLYLEYEEDLVLSKPFVPEDVLEAHNADNHTLTAVPGIYIESENFYHVFQTDVKLAARRAVTQNIAVNVAFQLPPNADPARLDRDRLAQFELQIQQMVRQQVMEQLPIVGSKSRLTKPDWIRKTWI